MQAVVQYHVSKLSITCGDSFSIHAIGFCGVFLAKNWHTAVMASTSHTNSKW